MRVARFSSNARLFLSSLHSNARVLDAEWDLRIFDAFACRLDLARICPHAHHLGPLLDFDWSCLAKARFARVRGEHCGAASGGISSTSNSMGVWRMLAVCSGPRAPFGTVWRCLAESVSRVRSGCGRSARGGLHLRPNLWLRWQLADVFRRLGVNVIM